MHGASLTELSGDAVWLLVAQLHIDADFPLTFKRAVRRAKVDGTLGHY